MTPERATLKDHPVALLFPGQGSQFAGMGLDIVAEDSRSREKLELADEILGYPLSLFMAGKSGDELNQTVYTQPAIFVHSMLVWDLLESRLQLKPLVAAGHSLGEYSALCAAGVLKFEDALKLVRTRAEAMNCAQPAGACGMAAVMGVEPDRIREIVESVKQGSVLDIGNYNSPEQFVISGEIDALERAKEILTREKRSRVVSLPVSSAFHTELMRPAIESLRAALNETPVSPAKFSVVANFSAEPYPDDTATIREILLRQLVSPVLWESSIRKMINFGATHFVEIGPGKVLSGLMKRIDRSVKAISVSNIDGISALAGEFQ
ncbi:MAG: ACP S-malonyltransferase [Desulfomonilaceae bacterium]